MDPAQLFKAKWREIEDYARRQLPIQAGRIATDHFHENFHKGGFVNNGLHPWQPAKRQLSGSKKAFANYGTLFSGRKHLYKSVNYIPGNASVTVKSNLPYSAIHNEGGTITQQIKPRKSKKGKGKGRKSLALPKRVRVIRMPRRQFIGESQELSDKISQKIEQEVNQILNS